MDWGLIGTISGIMFGLVTLVFGGLAYHASNQEKVENLKFINQRNLHTRLEKEVQDFKETVATYHKITQELIQAHKVSNTKIEILQERLSNTIARIDRYEDSGDKNMQRMIKTEIAELGRQLRIYKQGRG